MKITKIFYNWMYGTDHGEDYSIHTVGLNNVTKIDQHTALGEGDKWHYDVHFEDGSMERIFNINKVFFVGKDTPD